MGAVVSNVDTEMKPANQPASVPPVSADVKVGSKVESTVGDNNAASSKSQPTPVENTEKKFTGRCRLFVGNLWPDIKEAEFKSLFEPYGEISEVYVNSARSFGFIRLDYRHNA